MGEVGSGSSRADSVDTWDLYVSGTGRRVVAKEMAKALGTDRVAIARVQVVMDRVASGQTASGDVKSLRDEILEVRVSVGGNSYRLLFARCPERCVLLGLHFLQKKSQRTPPGAIDLAAARWGEWRERELLK